MTPHLFTAWLTEYFKPTTETYYPEKMVPFKILLLDDNVPIYPKALMKMHRKMNVDFTLTNTTFILKPMDEA